MDLWFAGLLGIVQGLTEFLPISSTAHLRIAPELFGQGDPGAAFSAVIQLGTLLAVVVYYRRRLFIELPRGFFLDRSGKDARLVWQIVVGTIPIVIAGLLLKDYVTGAARSLYVVASALAVVGIAMYLIDRRGEGERDLEAFTFADAALIGIAQTFALIPGTSRSGATILCALILGTRRSAAAEFSFLLSIPAIAGSGLFELKDAADALGGSAWGPIVVGTATAFVSGYLSIAWLLRYLKKRSLAPFAIYRVVLGCAILALVGAGIVSA
jgi:undecaprenyl-diphosphatase